MSDAAYAAWYFLIWQVATHGGRFASRRSKSDARADAEAWFSELEALSANDLDSALAHYCERYHFTGIIANVPGALCAWLRGQWRLTLCEYIPSPLAVLAMQARGTRPVTVFSDPERLHRPVLTKINAFAFMVHDLEHAHKFFHDPDLHGGQLRFFREIESAEVGGMFGCYRHDPIFAEKFDYLISDMNTHVMHSLQYLRAILIEHHLRRESKPMQETLSREGDAAVDDLMAWLVSRLGFRNLENHAI